jgi:hypothetical protein
MNGAAKVGQSFGDWVFFFSLMLINFSLIKTASL